MKINKILFTILWVCGLTTACTQSEEGILPDSGNRIARFSATIGENVESRATLNNDQVSYFSFGKDDEVGFYAKGGLQAENTPLTYSGGFSNNNLKWTSGDATNVFAYFPYSKDANIDIYDDQNKRFIDMLTCQKGTVDEGHIIGLTFTHRFALLAINRGKGFDQVKEENDKKRVTATLDKKIAHNATIKKADDKYDISITADDANGTNSLTSTPGKAGLTEHIIVPIVTTGGTEVASITLTNDEGREITITSPLKYFTESKYQALQSNTKYIITIEMKDNAAVVSPIEIVRWDEEEVDIKEPAGIKKPEDLQNWASAYNTEKQDNTELIKYGSQDDNGKWTFLLLNDINFTNETFNGITEFKDTFDGQGHTITGLTIKEDNTSSDKPLGFVRTLKTNACIKRLILKNVTFNCQGSGAVGAFAGVAESDSKIDTCSVTGSSIIYGTKAEAIIGDNQGATTSENYVESGVGVFQKN